MSYFPHDALSIALLVLVVLFIVSIIFGQFRKPGFDVRDLFMNEGKVDLPKFTVFTSFIFATWALVYLLMHDKFSEGYFVIYIGTYCGNQIAQAWLSTRGK
jgi:hypothetical protein